MLAVVRSRASPFTAEVTTSLSDLHVMSDLQQISDSKRLIVSLQQSKFSVHFSI